MNVLKMFGLTTIKKYDEKVDALIISLAEQNIATKLENVWKQDEEEISFDEFRQSLGREKFDKVFWDEDWEKYYSIYHSDQHESFKLRNLTKEPHLLNAFMMEFGSFDWNIVYEYMQKTNWTWGDKNVTPSINELKDGVITLIPLDGYESEKNVVSSGGFSLSLFYKSDGSAYCKIDFELKSNY